MIRSILLTFALSIGSIATPASAAEAIQVSWDAYTGTVPIARVVVDRSENGGAWRQVASVTNPAATEVIDRNTKRKRNYCYRGRTVTAGGTYSPYSNSACVRTK